MTTIKTILVIVFLSIITAKGVSARLKFDVPLWLDNTTPVAIVPFVWQGPGKAPEALDQIIGTDLSRSGRISPVPTNELQELPSVGGAVNYAAWRNAEVQYIVLANLRPSSNGMYEIEFVVLDAEKPDSGQLGGQVYGQRFVVKKDDLRTYAHHMSDIIYEIVIGEPGAFNTRLAYVTVTKDAREKSVYRLAVSDSDGYNELILFSSSQPILSPAWSPDGEYLAYVSYETGRPEVYVKSIRRNYVKRVTKFKGSSSAPAWSPDGRYLAMALSKDGNHEIYIMDLKTEELIRVTRSSAIDTEPVWFPDGKSLVFTSDRGGRAQLYRVYINRRGALGRPNRLTFDGKENMKASISPDGKNIAMVHNAGGRYRIAVLDLESDQLTFLSDGSYDESPSFAPNGSMLIYASHSNDTGVLVIVSQDGRAKTKLRFQNGEVRQPAWSPFKKNSGK